MLALSPTTRRFRALTSPRILASRFKKNSPRVTHFFYDLIDILDDPCELVVDDYQLNELVMIMYLKKIYASYVFFLKARVDETISTPNSLTIKKLVLVGGIFS